MAKNQRLIFWFGIVAIFVTMIVTFDGWLHRAVANVKQQGGSPPVLPMRVYGTIKLEDSDIRVPASITIAAVISDTVFSTTTTFFENDETFYVIDIPGDPPSSDNPTGGNTGSLVSLQLLETGCAAPQTTSWKTGVTVELNLLFPAHCLKISQPVPNPVPIPEPITIVLYVFGLGLLSANAIQRYKSKQ